MLFDAEQSTLIQSHNLQDLKYNLTKDLEDIIIPINFNNNHWALL